MSSAHTKALDHESAEAVENEIRELEEQLARAKARRRPQNTADGARQAHHHDDEKASHQAPRLPTSTFVPFPCLHATQRNEAQ